MVSRLSFLFLSILISLIFTNARNLAKLGEFDEEIENESNTARNKMLCKLCEEFTSQATHYLSENATRSEIPNTIHKACAELHFSEEQCIPWLDYLAPILFSEVFAISHAKLFRKVNACKEAAIVTLSYPDNPCTLCHDAVAEIITKLEDPDTELEVIEILLKGCNKMMNYVQKCKKFVFQYGPLILANAEKFLQKVDVCAAIHACKNNRKHELGSILADG